MLQKNKEIIIIKITNNKTELNNNFSNFSETHINNTKKKQAIYNEKQNQIIYTSRLNT